MTTLYRVQSLVGPQGLWYSETGQITDYVKTLEGYRNADLPMKWEARMAGGWHSAVDNLDDLKTWFNLDEMAQLETRGYGIYEFDVTSYRIASSETGIQHAVFQRDKVTDGYRRLNRGVLL